MNSKRPANARNRPVATRTRASQWGGSQKTGRAPPRGEITNPESLQIIRAALGKEPVEVWALSAWLEPLRLWDVAASRMETVQEWWFTSTPTDVRRMFLLFCAYDHDDEMQQRKAAK